MSELGNSRTITTNQDGLNKDLELVVSKHLQSEFKKPIAAHSKAAFAEIEQAVVAFLTSYPNGKIILDSCCGVGESSLVLATQNPNYLVIGIDKSEHRLDKNETFSSEPPANLVLVRGDLNDLWRMIAEQNWPIKHHYILYPNPWPKAKHLQRRWHGAPVFKYVLSLSEAITVRSNWSVYVEEFSRALELAGVESDVNQYTAEQAMTPFERKYWASGQQSYQLVANLSKQ